MSNPLAAAAEVVCPIPPPNTVGLGQPYCLSLVASAIPTTFFGLLAAGFALWYAEPIPASLGVAPELAPWHAAWRTPARRTAACAVAAAVSVVGALAGIACIAAQPAVRSVPGGWAWAATSVVVWCLVGGGVVSRWRTAEAHGGAAIPDYVLWWAAVHGATGVVCAVMAGRVGEARHPLQLASHVWSVLAGSAATAVLVMGTWATVHRHDGKRHAARVGWWCGWVCCQHHGAGMATITSPDKAEIPLIDLAQSPRGAYGTLASPIARVTPAASAGGDEHDRGEGDTGAGASPLQSASLPSRITFAWLQPLLRLGFTRPLEPTDLAALPPAYATSFVQSQYDAACSQRPPPTTLLHLLGVLHAAYSRTFYGGMALKLTYDVLQYISPLIINAIITWLQDVTTARGDGTPPPPTYLGYLYVVALFILSLMQTAMLHQYFILVHQLGMHLRSAVTLAVYRKSLRLSVAAPERVAGVGTITNLMSTDATRLQNLSTYIMTIVSGPWQIAIALLLLWQQLGVAALAGLGVMIVALPLNAVLARKSQALQEVLMRVKDARISATNEALTGIRLIKLSGWEAPFHSRIAALRNTELGHLLRYTYLAQVFDLVWTGLPLLVSLASFGAYTGVNGRPPTAASMFTSISLFGLLRFPLAMLPAVINAILESRISLRRIANFLAAEETDQRVVGVGGHGGTTYQSAAGVGPSTTCAPGEIVLTDAQFVWRGGDSTPAPSAASAGAGGSNDSGDALWKGGGEGEAVEATAIDVRPLSHFMKPLTLRVAPGQLYCVVGKVGSGKTSLLMGLLGEMRCVGGVVGMGGRVAYAPQTPFILNATVRENILFGAPWDPARYDRVLDVTQLRPDLALLPAGDGTEIGERGVTLSGGQQARVGLARAAYADAEVYLFDDVLAAVDAGVGERIMTDCIATFLTGRTRVLVTHGMQYLAHADAVVEMEDGAITGVVAGGHALTHGGAGAGTHGGSVLKAMMEEYGKVAHVTAAAVAASHAAAGSMNGDGDGVVASPRSEAALTAAPGAATPAGAAMVKAAQPAGSPATSVKGDGGGGDGVDAGRVMQEEGRERGRVRWRVFATYIQAFGGWPVFLALLAAFAATQAVSMGANGFLSLWSASIDDATPVSQNLRYLGIYAGISLGSLLFIVVQGVLLARAVVRAARTLHDQLITTLLRVPISFMDTTPLGRILNRVSNDMYTVDESLGETMGSLLSCSFTVLGTIILVATSTPLFLAAIVPLAVWYVYIQRYYVSTSRELQRLNSMSGSPIYAHFSESVAGTVVIRAFQRQGTFAAANARLLDINQRAYFLSTTANRWLAIRLETLGTMMTVGSALFAIVRVATSDSVDPSFPALAGLAISTALGVTQTLNWLVRMTSDAETEIVSVERLAEYAALPTETEVPHDAIHPSPTWPATGSIDIHNLKLAYRSGLPLVLHGITVAIPGGSHVGIVGRTGAGKSSFISALFLTADVQSGTITIDGIPIHRVPLSLLRSRLTIIPQTPILFSGTLRTNLDVLGQYTDDQLWDALDKVGMADVVRSLPQGLLAPVTEGGSNFSAGQRQLFTICRALLRNSKVIVLDEVSASVDVQSDAVLQRALRSHFRHSTVLTIAHRVHTLADSDRILTLDAGKLVADTGEGGRDSGGQ